MLKPTLAVCLEPILNPDDTASYNAGPSSGKDPIRLQSPADGTLLLAVQHHDTTIEDLQILCRESRQADLEDTLDGGRSR